MLKVQSIIKGAKITYKIIGLIGSGNISQVYKATDLEANREYAVKIIEKFRFGDNKQNLYYEKEINVIKKLGESVQGHKNIINIYEIIKQEDKYIVIQEYLKQDLFNFIQSLTQQPDDNSILEIFACIAEGVSHLHKLDIVHRDLKPENILINISPTSPSQIDVKIIDFGISVIRSQSIITSLVGSITYMALEILQNKSPYNEKCDVWSMGCIFHEIITGQQLFQGRDIGQVYKKIISFKEYTYENKMKDIIQKCMQIDPEKRISSHDLALLLRKQQVKKSSFMESFAITEPYSCTFIDYSIRQINPRISFRENEQFKESLVVNKNSLTCQSVHTYCDFNNSDETINYFNQSNTIKNFLIDESQEINQKQSEQVDMPLDQNPLLSSQLKQELSNLSIKQLPFSNSDGKPFHNQESPNHSMIFYTNQASVFKDQMRDKRIKYEDEDGKKQEEEEEEQQILCQNYKSLHDQLDHDEYVKGKFENIWQYLQNSKNVYWIKSSIPNFTINQYNLDTEIDFVNKKYCKLDKKQFYYAFYHLIIVCQLLKQYQDQKSQYIPMKDSMTDLSPFFLLSKDIVDKIQFYTGKSVELEKDKDYQRFICGLSEIDGEVNVIDRINLYYKLLRFKSFRNVMKQLGEIYQMNQIEIKSVFSVNKLIENGNLNSRIGENKIDEITYKYFNKNFHFFLNKEQCSILKELQKYHNLLKDIIIKQTDQQSVGNQKIQQMQISQL